ncbi:MAG: PH domain-containing protein [Erythrobacter sp.]|uniref:PH domain-containing protein n=1 Tax=Erythrobacter sp. TaxID=1042 RepID=UPI002612CF60|nr:PH domain-containing protein [Erythrobacter sp.]MDJ0979574.1 PH domain-containing protein [Erythrobacter sp.]
MDSASISVSSDPVSPAPAVSASISTVAQGDAGLTKLDPAYKTALRISVTLTAIPFVVGAFVAEAALASAGEGGWPLPFGVLIGIVVFLALAFIIRLPGRRWQARGYAMGEDRLRVVRGILWRSDTIVPFGRIQHIDVDQGPIERALGIATLTLHTAGNHNASVPLPGLRHEIATEMREDIRQRIKRDSL